MEELRFECAACKISVGEYDAEGSDILDVAEVSYQVFWLVCPVCGEFTLFVQIEEKLIMVYPQCQPYGLPIEIPPTYQREFQEAYAIRNISPKSCAALCRRVLEGVLTEEYSLEERSLAQKIDRFLELPGIPAYLTDSVDAVRNLGNLAAHPIKTTGMNELDIIDVEISEAEWVLEVIESLFDFVFVKPKRLARRREKMNRKLATAGKPSLKS